MKTDLVSQVKGKRVLFCGDFEPMFNRKECEALITAMGGKIAENVKKASIVIAGRNGEFSRRYHQAQNMNKPIWDLQKFYELDTQYNQYMDGF